MPWRMALCRRMTPELSGLLRGLSEEEARRLREIRIRTGRPVELVFRSTSVDTALRLDDTQMDEVISALSGYARHAVEQPLAKGFIPLEGGHRAGVAGRWRRDIDGQVRMTQISSVCIRIAHAVPGASKPIREFLLRDGMPLRVLLLGAPGCGKTTVLRDAALWLSDDRGLHVCAADEREELFAQMPEDGTGKRLDVLGGADKADAIGMMLRSMSPQVIVTDEIGRQEDARALADAAECGVGLVATAHAASVEEAMRRPMLREVMKNGVFDRVILLGMDGQCLDVTDACGKPIRKGS